MFVLFMALMLVGGVICTLLAMKLISSARNKSDIPELIQQLTESRERVALLTTKLNGANALLAQVSQVRTLLLLLASITPGCQ